MLLAEIKCPVCNKKIGTNEIEAHLLACLSKPRVSYNGKFVIFSFTIFITLLNAYYTFHPIDIVLYHMGLKGDSLFCVLILQTDLTFLIFNGFLKLFLC